MNRGFWFVAGAGAGVWAMVKARRTAEAFTPDGLSDRWAGLQAGARVFGEEVRRGAAEKETELRTRIGAHTLELESGRPPTNPALMAAEHTEENH